MSQIKSWMDSPAVYKIRVMGRLDQTPIEWFKAEIKIQATPEGLPITRLTGTVADQAALMGLLRCLYALGLPLLSVSREDSPAENSRPLENSASP